MKTKLPTKLAMLSISLFLMSHLAIAPAIPKLYALYHGQNPHIGLASVESLVTIPAMMITIFVMLSHLVVATLGKKKNDPTGIGIDSNIRSGIFFHQAICSGFNVSSVIGSRYWPLQFPFYQYYQRLL